MNQHLQSSSQLLPSFQKLFKSYSIGESALKCSSNQTITRFCTNPKCLKQAAMCNNLQCPKCAKDHKFCFHILENALRQLLTSQSNVQYAFFSQLFNIEDQIIRKISQNRRQITKKVTFANLDEKYIKVLENIYIKKEFPQNLNGSVMQQLYKTLQSSTEFNSAKKQKLLKTFQASAQLTFTNYVELKQSITSSYLTGTVDQKIEQFYLSSSEVLKHCSCLNKKMQLLKESLGSYQELKLLFRASQHNFSASKFHQKCDNIPNTISIIKNEFDKVFGGYTPVKWNQTHNSAAPDNSKQSFLISFDLNKKIPLVTSEKAIVCHQSYGPVFGSGNDIQIVDGCHLNSNSYSKFPMSYNNGFQMGQQTWTAFCGASQGLNFRVVEYEVFEVIY